MINLHLDVDGEGKRFVEITCIYNIIVSYFAKQVMFG